MRGSPPTPEQPVNDSEERWLAALGRSPADGDAVAALRTVLLKGLRAAMAGRAGVTEADIEDFTQIGTLRVLDQLGTFERRSRLSTWAMAIAIRVAMTELRRRRWAIQSLSGPYWDPFAARGDQEPTAPCIRGDDEHNVTALREAIDTELTPHQRAAILAELSGIPTEVIAHQLGLSLNALYKLHYDARSKLRLALTPASSRASV